MTVNLALLVTWIDLFWLFVFGISHWLVFRWGRRAGVSREKERILMNWVRQQIERSEDE